MSADELMRWAESRGVTFERRDGRLVIIGIRKLPKAKQAELLAALASKPPSREPRPGHNAPSARVAPLPAPPREPTRARPAPGPEPELYVGGRRVTEADVIEALSDLGDEKVQEFREGRLPKEKAYRIARGRLRTIAEMSASGVFRSPYRDQW